MICAKHATVQIDEQWIKSVTDDSNEILHDLFKSQSKVCLKSIFLKFDDVVSEICENVPSVENVEASHENISAEIFPEYFESYRRA